MMFVALILRPWMKHMDAHQVDPRTLADDLLITAAGRDCKQRTINATLATHAYLQAMGSKVATTKSILFASDEKTRIALRKHTFGRILALALRSLIPLEI